MKIIGNTLMGSGKENDPGHALSPVSDSSGEADIREVTAEEAGSSSSSNGEPVQDYVPAQDTKKKPAEHKALTVLKAFCSVVLMIALLAGICWEITGVILRQTFRTDSVNTEVSTMSFSKMNVGGWITEEDEDLSEYIWSYLGKNSGLTEQNMADVLDSDEFRTYAAGKLNDYVHYIYSRKDDVTITTEELAVLIATQITGANQEKIRAALSEMNPEQYSASALEEEHPHTIALLHYLTSVILMVLIGIGMVLDLILLIVLNRKYLHHVLFYVGVPLAAEGVLGVLIRLFSYPMEALIHGRTGIPEMIVNKFFEQFSESLLSASLIVLIVGAVFLVLFVIIHAVLGLIRRRAQAKAEAEV